MKKCKDCEYCKRLYRRAPFSYYRDDNYYCAKREDITSGISRCERWKKKKRKEIDLSSERFDDASEDIKYLTEYFKAIGYIK